MHFILRRISAQGVEMTTVLGEGYTLVTLENSPDEFKSDFHKLFDKHWIPNSDDAVIFGLISSEHGDTIKPLYTNQQNYIMTSKGDTFTKIYYSPSL